jgi:histidine triad (HIT) family protein
MPTLFTRIIEGEIPGHFVWRDDRAVAILTIGPFVPGHTMVIPIEEVDSWLDLAPDLAGHLMNVSQIIGQALLAEYGSERVSLMIAGLEVPHTHVHVMPLNDMGDLDFRNAAKEPPVDLADHAQRIRSRLRAMGRAEVTPEPGDG